MLGLSVDYYWEISIDSPGLDSETGQKTGAQTVMASVSRDTPFSSAGPRALGLRAYKPQHASGRRGTVMDRPSCELAGRRGTCTVAHAQKGGGRVGWQRWIRVGAAGGQVGGEGRERGSATRDCGGSPGSKIERQNWGTGSEWRGLEGGRDGLGSDSEGLRCSWGRGAKGLRRFAVAASREV